jgi:hypothetical protein
VCHSVWQCVAVRVAVCGSAQGIMRAVRAAVYPCVTVSLVVYDSARGSVRLSGSAAVCGSVRQCAAVCGSVCAALWQYCGSVRQCERQ